MHRIHFSKRQIVSKARYCLYWMLMVLPLGASTALMEGLDQPGDLAFDRYLQAVTLTDFERLQRDRLHLSARKAGSGDQFLCHLTEHYMTRNPVTWENLDETLTMGEACFSIKEGVDFKANGVYRGMGHYILNTVARFLEHEMELGRFHPADRENRPLLGRLEARKIYLSVPETSLNKIAFHVREGNWAYLLKRINNKSSEMAAKSAQRLAKAPPIVYIGIGSLFGILWLNLRSRRFLFGLAVCVAGLIPSVSLRQEMVQVEMLPQGFLHDDGMKIDQLQDQSGRTLGQAIWLDQRALRVNYLTGGDVADQYAGLARNQKVVIATTGGFTNSLAQPEGFTVAAGEVINAAISPERHALVLVDRAGGLNVLDLRAQQQSLPDGQVIGNPIRSLAAYAQLLDWCRNHQATVFQTQLLAAQNQVLVDPAKAVNRFRERRMLALVSDAASGESTHLMINLTKQHTLAEATARAHALANGRDFRVDALINLDVGLYDILSVFNESGQKVEGVQGEVSTDEAANLIVYSLAEG